jgi:ComF family protein
VERHVDPVGALARAWGELAAALWPPLCWLCRAAPAVDGYGCAEHALAAARFDPAEPRCGGCAARLPAGIRGGLCAVCRREPRGYERLVALGPYRRVAASAPGNGAANGAASGALRAWVLALKHGGRRELAGPLGALLADALRAAGGPPPGAVLVGVPLHPLRGLERGYDQARLLGREVARRLDLELVPALARTRWTAPQGEPGARSRAANVARAFALRRRAAARLAGRPVVLVDDVVTSGATVRACAAALRAARPAAIHVLVLARAEHRAGREGEHREDAHAERAPGMPPVC